MIIACIVHYCYYTLLYFVEYCRLHTNTTSSLGAELYKRMCLFVVSYRRQCRRKERLLKFFILSLAAANSFLMIVLQTYTLR